MKKLSDVAMEVLEFRYLGEGETPDDMFRRVARLVASVEDGKKMQKSWETKFYHVMSDLYFLPNTPTLINAGRPAGQLAACFVLPVGDSIPEIFEAIKNMAIVQKGGGGTGFSFSRLRPEGAIVEDTGGIASGPVSFMKVFDAATGEMKQGGVRRGANMGVLRVDHPDIMKFIKCKNKEGDFSNFNISVGITDEFMKCLRNSQPFQLRWESSTGSHGIETQEVNPSIIWKEIVDGAWRNGEPGLVFLDTINENNPVPGEEIEGTNPCFSTDSTFLKKSGLVTLSDVNVGDKVWSEDRWVTVTSKTYSGLKNTYRYYTSTGTFIGTKSHEVVQNGKKIKVFEADGIDLLKGRFSKKIKIFPKTVMDGIVLGDGYVHKTHGGRYETVNIKPSEKDFDYFNSEVKDFFIPNESKDNVYRVITSVKPKEIPYTFLRKIPNRYKFRNKSKICSLLRGLYSANGYVIETGNRIGHTHSSFRFSKDIQLMLSAVGISSYLTENREMEVEFPNGVYTCKKSYIVNIIRDRKRFRKIIGFIQKYKSDLLNKICRVPIGYKEKTTYGITSYEFHKKEKVWDITVDGPSHTLWSGGLNVGNCGEQPLVPNGTCNLGSIDVSKFVDDSGMINWEAFKSTIVVAVRFLDNVIDVNHYPLEDIKREALKTRRIGLGIMGLADLFIKMKVRYGSEESFQIAEDIMECIKNTSWDYSKELGKEKGVPPYLSDYHITRRNGALTTIAPTGSLSLIANCSSGCEPVFSFAYEKRCIDSTVNVIHPLYDDFLKRKHKVNEPTPDYFVTAKDVIVQDHVKMQGVLQKYVDAGISKTINAPRDISKDAVGAAFALAYDVGCTAVTFYREGSRQLEGHTDKSSDKDRPDCVEESPKSDFEHISTAGPIIFDPPPMKDYLKRPRRLTGFTDEIKTGIGKLYVTVNELEGKPFEVFLKIGKSGRSDFAYSEALGRLISVALRFGVPIEKIIQHLKDISGDSTTWDYNQDVKSVPDAVSIILENRFGEINEDEKTLVCPECESTNTAIEGGCLNCKDCGFSKC